MVFQFKQGTSGEKCPIEAGTELIGQVYYSIIRSKDFGFYSPCDRVCYEITSLVRPSHYGCEGLTLAEVEALPLLLSSLIDLT